METVIEGQKHLFDLKQMDEVAAGSPEFLAAMSQVYLDTIPVISDQLVQATKAGEWPVASKLAHRLKSTIDSLNMHSIKSDIRAIEIDSKNKVNTECIKMLAVKVDKVITAVANQLKIDFNL
jgi:HPt (histidine-containing phosphotransfer) domain-containing protein